MVVVWTLDKYALIAGIDWHFAQDGKQAKAVAKRLRKEEKGVQTLLVPNGDGSWLVGKIVGKLPKVKRQLVAAAPLLAQCVEHGIVVIRLNDEKYWLLAVSNGCVLPQHEVIVSAKEYQTVLQSWLQEMVHADLLGDVLGAIRNSEQLQEEIHDRIVSGDINAKILQASKIGSLDQIIHAAVLLTVVGGIGFCGFILWKAFFGQQIQPPSVNLNVVNAALEEQKDRERQARLRARFEAAVEEERKKLADADAPAQVRRVLAGLSTLTPPEKYTRFAKVECNLEQKQWNCSTYWTIPGKIGLLARAQVSGIDKVKTNMLTAGASQEVIPGVPFSFPEDDTSFSGRRVALPEQTELWEMSLKDAITAQGWTSGTFQFEAIKPITVAAAAFREDGHALRDTPDATIGHILPVRIYMPVSEINSWLSWVEQYPCRLKSFALENARAMMYLEFIHF